MPFAVVIHGKRDLRVERRGEQPLGPGRVRVALRAGGICGSDLHYFNHGSSGSFVLAEPLVLGHEIAGEVVETAGPCALAPGDRVAVNPSRPCGRCGYCLQGRPNLCTDIFFMGSASRRPHMQGGFASRIDVHAEQCVKMPDGLAMAHAALAEPLAVCLHAANRAGDLAGRRVLVIGAGPIGLLLVAVARAWGSASVVATDISEPALDRARAMGADAARLAGSGAGQDDSFDVVFEASGSAAGLSAAIGAADRGATVVQVGNLQAGAIAIPANDVMAKELNLLGSFRFGDEYAEAVALLASGGISVEAMITGRFPLADAAQAFEIASDRSLSSKCLLISDE